MRRPWLALTLLLAPTLALAADDDGFQPLFNGKDLTGWVLPPTEGLFSVEDGVIVGRTKGDLKKNQFLVSEKSYGDFDLKFKVKIRNHNSGLQFRSERRDDGTVKGPQCDVADGFWGLLYEENGRGILERYPEDKANALVKKGDWNEFEILAKGDHVVIHLNGTKIIDRTDPEFKKTGILGLQVHTGPAMEVMYKDIKIKTLD